MLQGDIEHGLESHRFELGQHARARPNQPPDAIDTVYAGQDARLRFPAFDQRSTPELFGTVASVSPDSVTDTYTGQNFYRVTVDIPDAELARLDENELIPGMPLEAFLQTGERSVLNFLIKPFTDQFSHAFRES